MEDFLGASSPPHDELAMFNDKTAVSIRMPNRVIWIMTEHLPVSNFRRQSLGMHHPGFGMIASIDAPAGDSSEGKNGNTSRNGAWLPFQSLLRIVLLTSVTAEGMCVKLKLGNESTEPRGRGLVIVEC